MPQKLLCEITQIIDHGEHVYSVFLKPENQAPRFKAGQFLHLALDEYRHGDFWPESRAFSIVSSPDERRLLCITYAVNGEFTRRIEATLRPGKSVWIKMPYGEFAIGTDSRVCLLAGGTGITAFTGFLAWLQADYPHAVHLFYGARRPDLLIYRPLVETAAEKCPNLHAHYFAEQDSQGTDCLPGRIDLDFVWDSLTDPLSMPYYLSGPPVMLQALKRDLEQRGIPADRILMDAWE